MAIWQTPPFTKGLVHEATEETSADKEGLSPVAASTMEPVEPTPLPPVKHRARQLGVGSNAKKAGPERTWATAQIQLGRLKHVGSVTRGPTDPQQMAEVSPRASKGKQISSAGVALVRPYPRWLPCPELTPSPSPGWPSLMGHSWGPGKEHLYSWADHFQRAETEQVTKPDRDRGRARIKRSPRFPPPCLQMKGHSLPEHNQLPWSYTE